MLEQYAYNLSENLIAKTPADPRDSARLFVYDTKTDEVTFDIFKNLAKYIPTGSLLVLNATKVVPARVLLKKEGGGEVEALFLINEYQTGDTFIRGMVNRRLDIGNIVHLGDVAFEVVGQEAHIFHFKPLFDMNGFADLLFKYGSTPIPKYIKGIHMEEEALRDKYQSIFAENPASIAAPTASLHFTPAVFDSLKKNNIENTFITLHVGLGTFAPVTEDMLKAGRLHKEYYEIPEESVRSILSAKREKRTVIAVGTTTTRALEASADAILAGKGEKSSTDIFIHEPYDFKVIDGLITNFHIPKSSLMCLVDAFLTHKGAKRNLVDLYEIAIKEKFRFYSFGDAMLIL